MGIPSKKGANWSNGGKELPIGEISGKKRNVEENCNWGVNIHEERQER